MLYVHQVTPGFSVCCCLRSNNVINLCRGLSLTQAFSVWSLACHYTLEAGEPIAAPSLPVFPSSHLATVQTAISEATALPEHQPLPWITLLCPDHGVPQSQLGD